MRLFRSYYESVPGLDKPRKLILDIDHLRKHIVNATDELAFQCAVRSQFLSSTARKQR